jgi:hypothetical protein
MLRVDPISLEKDIRARSVRANDDALHIASGIPGRSLPQEEERLIHLERAAFQEQGRFSIGSSKKDQAPSAHYSRTGPMERAGG